MDDGDFFCALRRLGVYGEGFPVASCLFFLLISFLYPRLLASGGFSLGGARGAVGPIPEGLGVMAFSFGPGWAGFSTP